MLLFSGLSLCAGAAEPRRVDHDVTEAFAKVAVYYNGRVCPVNTVAIDFVTKLSGKASWKDYDADEIFAGWTFNSSAWESVPMIRIKDKVAQKDVVLDLPEKEWNFVRRSMDYLTESVLASDNVASAGTLFFSRIGWPS